MEGRISAGSSSGDKSIAEVEERRRRMSDVTSLLLPYVPLVREVGRFSITQHTIESRAGRERNLLRSERLPTYLPTILIHQLYTILMLNSIKITIRTHTCASPSHSWRIFANAIPPLRKFISFLSLPLFRILYIPPSLSLSLKRNSSKYGVCVSPRRSNYPTCLSPPPAQSTVKSLTIQSLDR